MRSKPDGSDASALSSLPSEIRCTATHLCPLEKIPDLVWDPPLLHTTRAASRPASPDHRNLRGRACKSAGCCGPRGSVGPLVRQAGSRLSQSVGSPCGCLCGATAAAISPRERALALEVELRYIEHASLCLESPRISAKCSLNFPFSPSVGCDVVMKTREFPRRTHLFSVPFDCSKNRSGQTSTSLNPSTSLEPPPALTTHLSSKFPVPGLYLDRAEGPEEGRSPQPLPTERLQGAAAAPRAAGRQGRTNRRIPCGKVKSRRGGRWRTSCPQRMRTTARTRKWPPATRLLHCLGGAAASNPAAGPEGQTATTSAAAWAGRCDPPPT